MMRLGVAAIFLSLLAGVVSAQPASRQAHPCARDAIAKATPLLKLHFDVAGGRVENLSIDERVKVLPPIRALKGNGRLDVLEVRGFIYKSEYRMRFIYVQSASSQDSCALMGQEILEASNPY
jgi:hypothetical protein